MMNLANFFRTLARVGTLLLGVSMIFITICSGALGYGISIDYMLWNLPNTLPYFLLLFVLFIAWDYEIIGGPIMLLLGLGTYYYLNSTAHNYELEFILVSGVILFSVLFILSWLIRKVHSLTFLN